LQASRLLKVKKNFPEIKKSLFLINGAGFSAFSSQGIFFGVDLQNAFFQNQLWWEWTFLCTNAYSGTHFERLSILVN
jgi:hypothetical protein